MGAIILRSREAGSCAFRDNGPGKEHIGNVRTTRHPADPPATFLRRLAAHVGVAIGVVLASLAGGMAGYVHFERLTWLDAFLNSAMLLGGMGPVDPPHTPGGKLFAGLYALYAGLVFLVVVGIVLGPLVHRLLHQFHWDEAREPGREGLEPASLRDDLQTATGRSAG